MKLHEFTRRLIIQRVIIFSMNLLAIDQPLNLWETGLHLNIDKDRSLVKLRLRKPYARSPLETLTAPSKAHAASINPTSALEKRLQATLYSPVGEARVRIQRCK